MMWCTRWYIPLLLFPFPKTQPFFLIVFLISLTLHARPCFYCVVLLAALLTSSCYWQPIPTSAPLTIPFNNATTFGEALTYALSLSAPNSVNSSLTNSSSSLTDIETMELTMPGTVKLLDRCWCSLQNGKLFEPFDVTKWEKWSVEWTAREIRDKARREKEKERALIKAKEDAEKLILEQELEKDVNATSTTTAAENVQKDLVAVDESSSLSSLSSPLSSAPLPSSTIQDTPNSDTNMKTTEAPGRKSFSLTRRLRTIVGLSSHQNQHQHKSASEVPLPSGGAESHPQSASQSASSSLVRDPTDASLPLSEEQSDLPNVALSPSDSSSSHSSSPSSSSSSYPPPPSTPLPFFRREYDIRPYGLNMIIDFGWDSSSS